ncbi:MAG TPA: LOG family protein [Planctomycetota bacterium]|nr:LOG family protein [Planctomycetota bacterium]
MLEGEKAPRPRKEFDIRALLEDVETLVRERHNYPDSSLILEMLETVLKCARDKASRGDLKVLNAVLKETRYAFKVFAPYRRIRKVSIFGSARTEPQAPEYEQARAFANRMTRLGWMIITGAGGGIMEAAQGGAGRLRSFGVNIRLPFEQKANTVIAEDAKLINFKYFFTRKLTFVKETDAIALFPGGFGTHDEGFESLTLVQTGKSTLLPIVFIDRAGGTYWSEWKEYVEEHLRDRGYIDPSDLNIFTVTDDVEEAARIIKGFYRNFHSMRFVGPLLVLRLREPVRDDLLEKINDTFAQLVREGRIERHGVFPEEESEPETHHLYRLAFAFDRRSVGQLRQLVDMLNEVQDGSL